MYMIVTNDEYELPVAAFENVNDIAHYLNISPSTVRTRIHRKHWKAEKIIRIDEGEKKRTRAEYQNWYHKTHDRSEYFRQYYQKKKARKNNEQGT